MLPLSQPLSVLTLGDANVTRHYSTFEEFVSVTVWPQLLAVGVLSLLMNHPVGQSVSLWVTVRRHYNEKCHQTVLCNVFFFFCWVLWAQSRSVIVQTSGTFSPLSDPRYFGGKLFLADCLLLFRGLMFVPFLPRGGWYKRGHITAGGGHICQCFCGCWFFFSVTGLVPMEWFVL